MSIVNEIFFISIIILLWTRHELGNTWLSLEVLPWVVISLIGAVNILNLVTMITVIYSKIKKERRRKRKSRVAQI